MKKVAILVMLLGMVVAIAQADKKPSNSGGGAQTTQTDKRGTEESPLVVNEHAIQSDKETAKEAARDAEQKHTDGWLIGLTFAIAVCALLQFLGICGQIFVYVKQKTIMKDTLDAISTQAGHMEAQLEEMKKAREIENKTLILQYRPRIIVRFANAKDFNLIDLGKPATAKVEITIVNTGGSPAHIGGGDIVLWWIRVPPSPHTNKVVIHKGTEATISEGILQPGQAHRLEETLDMDATNDMQWVTYHEGIATEDHRQLLLVGTIYYLDDLGIPRRTGIYRNFDAKTGNFNPAGNEGEYDD